MKKLLSIIAVLTLAACSTVAPNAGPVQPTNALQYGGLKWTSSGIAISSGNYAAIAPGTPGTGGSN